MGEGGAGCGNDVLGDKHSGLLSHLCLDERWAGGKPWPTSSLLLWPSLVRLQTQGWRARLARDPRYLTCRESGQGLALSEAWGGMPSKSLCSVGRRS